MSKNLNLDCKEFEENLIERTEREWNALWSNELGVQYVFRFENGYGASVIKHFGSYGYEDDLWELAVVKFVFDDTFELDYDTPITGDVEGYLEDSDVRDLLKRIKEL